jgi:hypothetical protein
MHKMGNSPHLGIAICDDMITTFNFEYHWTPEDVSDDWKSIPRSQWSNMFRMKIGQALVAAALYCIALGAVFRAMVLFISAILIVLWQSLLLLFVKRLTAFADTKFSLYINDDEVTTEAISRNQDTPNSYTIAWKHISNYGKALEHPSFYEIDYGRVRLWIPKRVFSDDEEESEFRTFVAEKMGDRCTFH